jgi:hypothetical protein
MNFDLVFYPKSSLFNAADSNTIIGFPASISNKIPSPKLNNLFFNWT